MDNHNDSHIYQENILHSCIHISCTQPSMKMLCYSLTGVYYFLCFPIQLSLNLAKMHGHTNVS
jgi:hypothetical protein